MGTLSSLFSSKYQCEEVKFCLYPHYDIILEKLTKRTLKIALFSILK